MPSSASVAAQFMAFEDSTLSLMARIVNDEGTEITQASLDEIRYTVISLCDQDDPIVDDGTLTITDVVFDTLQVPAIWTEDDDGYNFRYDVPVNSSSVNELPESGRVRFEFWFYPVSGQRFVVVFEGDVLETYGAE